MSNDSQFRAQAPDSSILLTLLRRPIVVATLALALVIGLDQLTKTMIWNSVGPEGARTSIDVAPGLRFIFVRNTGSAFGMFQGQAPILTFMTFGALALLALFFYRSARDDRLVALSLGLIIGGAVGNLIDRIRLSYVIDWIDVPRWPTFNVADSAITIGIILLMLAILFREPETADDESEPAIDGAKSVIESGQND